MKRLVMMFLVGCVFACGKGDGKGDPQEPAGPYGNWEFGSGADRRTLISLPDPTTGGFIFFHVDAEWKCSKGNKDCVPVKPPTYCPSCSVCNCMSMTDCDKYCANSYAKGSRDQHEMPVLPGLDAIAPDMPKPAN